MLEIAGGDVEILVHVSARSHGTDDRRYRAMAQAYLSFEPARQQGLDIEEREIPDVLDAAAGSQLQAELQCSTQESWESRASWQPDEEEDNTSFLSHHDVASQISLLQSMVSPELSFNSVADNVVSPVFQRAVACETGISKAPSGQSQNQEQDSSDSWKPPLRSVADSQPEPAQPAVVFSSPTRIFEYCLATSPNGGSPSSEGYCERVDETILNVSSEDRDCVVVSRSFNPFSIPRSPGRRLERLLRAQKKVFSPEELQTLEAGVLKDETLLTDPPIKSSSSENICMDSSPPPPKTPERRSNRVLRSQHPAAPSTLDFDSTCTTNETHSEVWNSLAIDLTSAATLFQKKTALSKQNQTCYDQPPESADSKLPYCSTVISIETSQSPSILDLAPHPQKRLHAELETVFSSPDPSNQPELSSSQDLPTRPYKRQNISKMSTVRDTQIQSSSPATVPRSEATIMKIDPDWSEVLEIHPAPPPTSTGELKPEMLITESLVKLAQRIGIVHLPTELKREPRPLERGYWLVDCSSWSDDLRRECWNMLGNYVGKGSAGWGVWCVRNDESSFIRVYSWGIVIEHIYKLLYLSSGKKTTNAGLCWISGDGETVIRMPSSS
jgi:hypothetical protein